MRRFFAGPGLGTPLLADLASLSGGGHIRNSQETRIFRANEIGADSALSEKTLRSSRELELIKGDFCTFVAALLNERLITEIVSRGGVNKAALVYRCA